VAMLRLHAFIRGFGADWTGQDLNESGRHCNGLPYLEPDFIQEQKKEVEDRGLRHSPRSRRAVFMLSAQT
jgi:hypothetical protein